MRALVFLVLVACVDPAAEPPAQSRVETFEVPGQPPGKLDVLIVLDNTAAAAPYAPRIAEMVRAIDGLWSGGPLRQPDLHVAVASADPAARGRVHGSALVDGEFAIDLLRPDWTRERNYNDALGDALASLASVGSDGTGSEPLAAIEPALAQTPGFVRDDAALGLVIVSANDDASTIDPAALAADLKAARRDPANVAVALVAPDAATRLHAFAAQFPNRATTAALSAATFVPALDVLRGWIKYTLGAFCLYEPADVDPGPAVAYDCSVEIVQSDGVVRPVPACPGEDCWTYVPDPQTCPDGPAGTITIGAYGWPLPSLLRGQCVR